MVSIYFSLWRVSRAEYILVLRVSFPLLQMIWCMSAITRTASILWKLLSRLRARSFPYVSSRCFCWTLTTKLAPYWTKWMCIVSKLCCFRTLFELSIVITYVNSDVFYLNSSVVSCEWWILNFEWSWLSLEILKSFGVSWTTGFIWAQVSNGGSFGKLLFILVLLWE